MSTTVEPSPEQTPGTAPRALLERRREALEESGWGAPFHLLQPHNACLWVYLALVASGVWYVVGSLRATGGAYNEAYSAAVVSSGLFAGAFLLWLHHADRWERTPARLAICAFVGGAFASPFALAINGNSALNSIYTKLLGGAWAADWQAGLSAPFVEETSKGIVVLLLLGLAPVTIRTVSDGLMVGAYVGLGFQILEDMFYAQNSAIEQFGANQSDAVLGTFALRAITGIPSHALYTALFGAGLIYLLGTRAQPRSVGRGLALIVAAMVIHGVWDSALAIAGAKLAVVLMAVLTVGSLLVLRAAIRWAGGSEREYMRALMAPEVATGTITQAELDALAAPKRGRGRRQAVRARPEGGSRRQERHVLRAARDLAQDLAAGGGDDTPQVGHSRDEVARLRA